jgi:hypothetical protein
MKCTRLYVLLLLFPAMAVAENFAGKWLIETETPFGRARTILELSQVEEKVGGTMMTVIRGMSRFGLPPSLQQQIHGAKIDGKTLTFYVWTGRDEPLKDIYKGVLTDKGEISFEVERGVGPPPAVPPNPVGGASPTAPTAPSHVTAVPVL